MVLSGYFLSIQVYRLVSVVSHIGKGSSGGKIKLIDSSFCGISESLSALILHCVNVYYVHVVYVCVYACIMCVWCRPRVICFDA